MDISSRLKLITEYIDSVDTLCDVGTDHGYIPIYALQNGLCKKAIASDINKEPLNKAKLNAIFENMGDELEFRLGSGLSTIKNKEVDAVVIAGMGGNLIKDILEADIEKVKNCKYLILQPAQNPEVLREYLYTNGYNVIQEDLCLDDEKYYEFFKVSKDDGSKTILDDIYYEISPKLLMSKHPLMKEYLEYKLEQYNKIESFIIEKTESAEKRKKEVEDRILIISNILKNF